MDNIFLPIPIFLPHTVMWKSKTSKAVKVAEQKKKNNEKLIRNVYLEKLHFIKID